MTEALRVVQAASFRKAVKRLHANQKRALDQAVQAVAKNPALGEEKAGDLAGVRIYKFHMVNQLVLLAYAVAPKEPELTLLALGTHENFYRNLKKR